MNGLTLPNILIGVVVLFGIFVILREFFCWYWKINQTNSLLEKQNEILSRMLKYVEREEFNKNKDRFPEATHIVNEDVKLRLEPDMSTPPIEILERGTLVVFIKEGAIIEDANCVSAPWFYVKTADGVEGWCFSGLLKKI